jgi:uncharacterized protein YjbJ (UPF0337 family)
MSKRHAQHGHDSCTDTRLKTSVPAPTQAPVRRWHVDKNRTEGTKHEIKGAVKEGIGKVTGNKTKQAAGNVEKNAGKVQKEVGKAADQARDSAKH